MPIITQDQIDRQHAMIKRSAEHISDLENDLHQHIEDKKVEIVEAKQENLRCEQLYDAMILIAQLEADGEE